VISVDLFMRFSIVIGGPMAVEEHAQ